MTPTLFMEAVVSAAQQYPNDDQRLAQEVRELAAQAKAFQDDLTEDMFGEEGDCAGGACKL